jgi:AraC-like DNA-binding protein
LATSLYEQAPVLNPDEELSGLEAFFHILSSCLGRSSPSAQGPSTNLKGRIETFIQANLADPALTPADIAAEAHISVRHLHRLFESQGRSVSDWIRERRLEACRAALSDPCMENKSITEIAFSWGFSDSSHFSRSFRKSFGTSPRQFRSQRTRTLNR